MSLSELADELIEIVDKYEGLGSEEAEMMKQDMLEKLRAFYAEQTHRND